MAFCYGGFGVWNKIKLHRSVTLILWDLRIFLVYIGESCCDNKIRAKIRRTSVLNAKIFM